MLRRHFLPFPLAFLAALPADAAAESLRIDSSTGNIDFAVGESVLFRTSGNFGRWQGTLSIDEANIPASRVQVSIDTSSVNTRDAQQDVQLRGPDFFDVAHFPVMNFVSTRVERTGAHALRITGDVTLRGITRPMVLAVEVTQDLSQAGPVAARFTATGQIKRSQFGMPKYLDITGDTVEIRISANAVR